MAEGEKHPRKRGQADTVGLLIMEVLTSGSKKGWKVCAYCTKWGKFPLVTFDMS